MSSLDEVIEGDESKQPKPANLQGELRKENLSNSTVSRQKPFLFCNKRSADSFTQFGKERDWQYMALTNML